MQAGATDQPHGKISCAWRDEPGRAGDLGHLLRLRRADALELDAGALLDEGHEALLAAVDERHADAGAARAARAPAAVDVRLGVLGRLAL
jgi:hypothetical protein